MATLQKPSPSPSSITENAMVQPLIVFGTPMIADSLDILIAGGEGRGGEGRLTSEEAEPLGQDVGSFGLDQNLAAVQRHAGTHLTADIKHGGLLLTHKRTQQPSVSMSQWRLGLL